MADAAELRMESQTLWLLAELSAETPARERLVSLSEPLHAAQLALPDDPQSILWLNGLHAALSSEDGWVELQKDFVRLFAAVYKEGGAIAPMMSAVLPDLGDMVQLTAQLRQISSRSGCTLPEEHTHAHDHVSTLLFLLAAQRFGQAQAVEEEDAATEEHYRRLFWYTFSHYVQPWVGAWSSQAAQHAQSPFYQAWLVGFDRMMHYLNAQLLDEDA